MSKRTSTEIQKEMMPYDDRKRQKFSNIQIRHDKSNTPITMNKHFQTNHGSRNAQCSNFVIPDACSTDHNYATLHNEDASTSLSVTDKTTKCGTENLKTHIVSSNSDFKIKKKRLKIISITKPSIPLQHYTGLLERPETSKAKKINVENSLALDSLPNIYSVQPSQLESHLLASYKTATKASLIPRFVHNISDNITLSEPLSMPVKYRHHDIDQIRRNSSFPINDKSMNYQARHNASYPCDPEASVKPVSSDNTKRNNEIIEHSSDLNCYTDIHFCPGNSTLFKDSLHNLKEIPIVGVPHTSKTFQSTAIV